MESVKVRWLMPVIDPVKRMAQVESVLDGMESGLSERAACVAAGIDRMTFRSAALKFQAASQYARASEAMAQNQVDLLESAIDDMRAGTIDSQMARVEIDARKWFASKFLPKRYGDKVDLNHGNQPGNPLTILLQQISGTSIQPIADDDEG